jgi:hypothetical protein
VSRRRNWAASGLDARWFALPMGAGKAERYRRVAECAVLEKQSDCEAAGSKKQPALDAG